MRANIAPKRVNLQLDEAERGGVQTLIDLNAANEIGITEADAAHALVRVGIKEHPMLNHKPKSAK